MISALSPSPTPAAPQPAPAGGTDGGFAVALALLEVAPVAAGQETAGPGKVVPPTAGREADPLAWLRVTDADRSGEATLSIAAAPGPSPAAPPEAIGGETPGPVLDAPAPPAILVVGPALPVTSEPAVPPTPLKNPAADGAEPVAGRTAPALDRPVSVPRDVMPSPVVPPERDADARCEVDTTLPRYRARLASPFSLPADEHPEERADAPVREADPDLAAILVVQPAPAPQPSPVVPEPEPNRTPSERPNAPAVDAVAPRPAPRDAGPADATLLAPTKPDDTAPALPGPTPDGSRPEVTARSDVAPVARRDSEPLAKQLRDESPRLTPPPPTEPKAFPIAAEIAATPSRGPAAKVLERPTADTVRADATPAAPARAEVDTRPDRRISGQLAFANGLAVTFPVERTAAPVAPAALSRNEAVAPEASPRQVAPAAATSGARAPVPTAAPEPVREVEPSAPTPPGSAEATPSTPSPDREAADQDAPAREPAVRPATLRFDPPALAAPRPLASGPAAQVFAAALRRGLRDARPAAVAPEAAAQPLPPVGPAHAAAPPAPTIDVAHERWPHVMVERIERLRDAAEIADTRVRLVPDALGAVEIHVRREGEAVHVHLAAEQPATRALLQDAAPRLAEAAEARGLRLGQLNVGGGGADANGARQQQPQAPAAPLSPPRARGDARAEILTDTRIA